MTSRILALAGAFLLAACASREAEPPGAADLASTPSKPPGLGEVPVTFSGLLPCAVGLDELPPTVLVHCTAERIEEKFGWLRDYREDLARWSQFETIGGNGGGLGSPRRLLDEHGRPSA